MIGSLASSALQLCFMTELHLFSRVQLVLLGVQIRGIFSLFAAASGLSPKIANIDPQYLYKQPVCKLM